MSLRTELSVEVRSEARVEGDNSFQREDTVTPNDRRWVRVIRDLWTWISLRSVEWSTGDAK